MATSLSSAGLARSTCPRFTTASVTWCNSQRTVPLAGTTPAASTVTTAWAERPSFVTVSVASPAPIAVTRVRVSSVATCATSAWSTDQVAPVTMRPRSSTTRISRLSLAAMVMRSGVTSRLVGAGGSDTENETVRDASRSAPFRAVTMTLFRPGDTGTSQANDWPDTVAFTPPHVSHCTPDTGSSTFPRMVVVVLDGSMKAPSSGA